MVEVASLPCAGRLALSEENLTRILLNLVRNAAEAMPRGGRVRITAQRGGGESFLWILAEGPEAGSERSREGNRERGRETVILCVEDTGPGIPAELQERVFEPGYSTHRDGRPWPEAVHRGLGLSIVRELVEEAGGRVRVGPSRARGARLEIELPLTNVTPSLLSEQWSEGEREAQ
jgi:signal transduction histidine kinase